MLVIQDASGSVDLLTRRRAKSTEYWSETIKDTVGKGLSFMGTIPPAWWKFRQETKQKSLPPTPYCRRF